MSECKVDHNPTPAEREVEILKDVIRALLPNRHALGRIALDFAQKPEGGLSLVATVTVPLDRSNDESASRELAAALMPELREIAAAYERAASSAVIAPVLDALHRELATAEKNVLACGDRRDWNATSEAESMVSGLRFAIYLIERATGKYDDEPSCAACGAIACEHTADSNDVPREKVDR